MSFLVSFIYVISLSEKKSNFFFGKKELFASFLGIHLVFCCVVSPVLIISLLFIHSTFCTISSFFVAFVFFIQAYILCTFSFQIQFPFHYFFSYFFLFLLHFLHNGIWLFIHLVPFSSCCFSSLFFKFQDSFLVFYLVFSVFSIASAYQHVN